MFDGMAKQHSRDPSFDNLSAEEVYNKSKVVKFRGENDEQRELSIYVPDEHCGVRNDRSISSSPQLPGGRHIP